EQAVGPAVLVVVDAVPVPPRPVGEDRDDGAAGLGAGQPSGHQGDGAGAPAAGHVVQGGQGAAGPDRFGGGDPVDLVEGVVVDVARVDAGAGPAHRPRPGGLAEDRRAYGVDAGEAQAGEVAAQHTGDARAVPAGADRAHQGVDLGQLVQQFVGEPGVGVHVVGVVVLVGTVGAG